jgi:translation initiation factor 5B
VARDGVLPQSDWIGRVTSDGQPKNAVMVIYIFSAMILCSILPSQVAFTSLVSASTIPTIAAYGLISLLRLTRTPNHFQSSRFHLGRFAKPFYVCSILSNGLIFVVRLSFRHFIALVLRLDLSTKLYLTGYHIPIHISRRS